MASLHRDFESARAAAKRGDDLFTRIDLIVYERATFTMPNRAYSDVLAGFYALLEEHCERCDIRLQPVAVQTLKAFALPRVKRKKGDPKMDRGKAAMIAATVHRLSFPVSLPGEDPFDPKVLRGSQDFTRLNALTEHEADALWLYWWAKENCK